MNKPLSGIHIIELAGIGPGPHAAMIFADLGAEVVRVVRPGTPPHLAATAHTLRGRRSVVADLKKREDLSQVKSLVTKADVLVEGFRPGVLERLGLGPDDTRDTNPRLIHARMTGWGQTGPLAHTAGHDINYISLTGALHAIGTAEHPVPPLNLVGDYGGGSMMLVTGVLAALFERERTGLGQVVDAGMVDGASVLLQGLLELRDLDQWTDTRHDNILDGAAPFYRTYACSDGAFMAVGAIEPQFYALFVKGLGLDADALADRDDRGNWESLSKLFGARFAEQPREHWAKVFDGTDACVTPVLSFAESLKHPHVAARRSLVAGAGADSVVATVAPRLGAGDPTPAGATTEENLEDLVDEWSA